MDEDAPAGKLSRLEHQRSVGDDPSFRMENLPEKTDTHNYLFPLSRSRPHRGCLYTPATASRSTCKIVAKKTIKTPIGTIKSCNLHLEIQPVVMSLLPLKEAVRTSIVARSWRMLWRFHSNLCFYGPNDLDYDSDEYDDTDEQAIDDFIKIKRDNFIEDVNWVIQRHSVVGINKFSIRCGLHK
ncbi:hypothetical protein ACQ4PT_001020 [Festuca glaucescens]